MVTLVNRAKVNTATTGTGAITLGSAVDGYQTFAAAGVANGNVVRYVIEDGTGWEIGTGTYTATGSTLTRTVSESSDGGAAITLGGDATVFVGLLASDIVQVSDVGVTVQAYDANIVSDATYVHTDNNYTTAEKSKLAGVEAGATADQTAAQILTAVKTVDGAASGLDADLLDGLHASSFLQGNQTITLSGDATGSGTTSIVVTVADDSHNHVWGNIDGASVGSLVGPRFTTASGWIEFGPANTSWAHINTDRPNFYFYKGANFQGDITLTGTVDGRNVLADGQKLDGIAAGANNYSFPYTVSQASTANTVVQRNSSGDINARLFRSEYDSTNAGCQYFMTQVDTASNNYLRPSTIAQVRSAVGSGYTANTVGSYSFLRAKSSSTKTYPNNTVAGSTMSYTDADWNQYSTPSGTWRCMAYAVARTRPTLYLRIS